MKRNDKILEEVEKTLGSMDNISNLETNPFLITRIKTRIENDNIIQVKRESRTFILNPIVLTVILIINIITAVFLFQSSRVSQSNQSTLVNSLTKDYQFSQTKFDIFNTD